MSFFLKVYLWSLDTNYGELRELEYYGEEFNYLSFIHTPEGGDYFFEKNAPH